MKAREQLLLRSSQGVQGLKDLAATGGFDSSVHLVVLAAAQESVDPDGQAHSRMQSQASACREKEKLKRENVSERQKEAKLKKKIKQEERIET